MAKQCPTPQPLRNVLGTTLFLTGLFLLTFLARFVFPPLFPAIAEEIGLTSGQAGSLFLLAAVGSVVGSAAAGLISSRINHRGSLLLSVFGIAAAMFAVYFVRSVLALQILFVFLGMMTGIHSPSSIATLTATVRVEDWGKALSIQQLAPPASLVVGPLLAAAVLRWSHWDITLLVVAALAAGLGLSFFLFTGQIGGVGAFPGEAASPKTLQPVLRTRSFWLMVFLFALGMGAQVGVYSMLPLYLTGEREMSPQNASALLGLANIAPLVTVFLSGWVTARLGEKRTIGIFLPLTGLAMVGVGLLSGIPLICAVVLMAALAVCFFPPAFAALSRTVQPTYRSLASAFGPPLGFVLGGGLLPLGLGYLGEAASLSLGILITGGVVVVGSLAVLGLRLLETLEEGC